MSWDKVLLMCCVFLHPAWCPNSNVSHYYFILWCPRWKWPSSKSCSAPRRPCCAVLRMAQPSCSDSSKGSGSLKFALTTLSATAPTSCRPSPTPPTTTTTSPTATRGGLLSFLHFLSWSPEVHPVLGEKVEHATVSPHLYIRLRMLLHGEPSELCLYVEWP